MNHSEIVEKLKGYFDIHELVDKQTYTDHGERAWKFFDTRLLHTLLFIRNAIDLPITINNWFWGGKFSQRGLRTNTCSIVKKKTAANKLYLSAHVLGAAVDFDVKGMTAEEVRKWLAVLDKQLPYKIRLENEMNGKQINWVHLDIFDEDKNPQVYLFNI